MDKWDFDCPQFVDFSALLENDYPTDDFCNDVPSEKQPVPEERCAEAVVPRMATPKLRAVTSLRNSPFVKISRSGETDDEKVAYFEKLTSRLSKSHGCLNTIKSLRFPEKENLKSKSHRKRLLSDSCIKKSRICPTTPKCLKRTLVSKLKKAKTTEELELEKISEMQNKLQQHLRLNRTNFERLKRNKAPFTFRSLSRMNNCKVALLKNHEFEDLRVPSQPLVEVANGKLGCRSEKTCDMPIYKELVDNVPIINTNIEKLDKKTPPANVLRDLNGLAKDYRKAMKKPVPFETFKGHGGLKFISKKSETSPFNFSFDKSPSSSLNASLRKINACASSTETPKSLDNKENLVK